MIEMSLETALLTTIAIIVAPLTLTYVLTACRTPTGGFCFHQWEYPLKPNDKGIRKCKKCTSKQAFEGSSCGGMIETGLVWVWQDNYSYEKELAERKQRVQQKTYQNARKWYD